MVEDLEGKIVSGELVPRQRITEEALAAEYGVSRSSLREAFRILESQGYIIHEPRKGVCVTSLTPELVRDVYEVRSVLEGLAMFLAVKNISSDQIKFMERINNEMNDASKEKNMIKYTNLNQQFHEKLIEASENDFLMATLTPINKMVKRIRAELFMEEETYKMSEFSHANILNLPSQAIRKG